MTDPALQALLDKQHIAELLTGYLRSVDRGDVATLRACYLPGATEDHGGLFAGPAQDYVDSIAAALTHPRARTSHNMTNLLIDLDGDVATAESYCITFARIKADGQYYHSFTGARMIDRLERRDGDPRTWGIAHRQLLWDWNHDRGKCPRSRPRPGGLYQESLQPHGIGPGPPDGSSRGRNRPGST